MIIVKYEYAYWNDGHAYAEKIEEFNSVKDAIDCLSPLAYEFAINDVIDIVFTIPSGSEELISNGIKQNVKDRKYKKEVASIESAIRSHQDWLDNVDTEKQRRIEQIEVLTTKLEKLNMEK